MVTGRGKPRRLTIQPGERAGYLLIQRVDFNEKHVLAKGRDVRFGGLCVPRAILCSLHIVRGLGYAVPDPKRS